MKPVRLAPNLVEHFYRGGSRIAALRGIETTSEFQPEEWIGSTVSRAGEDPVGQARTLDGTLLREVVSAEHEAWTGPAAAASAGGSDVGLLFKLLDADERLPVHVHPDRGFSRSHLDCPYGKTESWFVLQSDPGAAVYLGWSVDVDADELVRRRDAQDSEWMLSHMNRVEVEPGMGVVVPAGTVHAIDGGIFVAEVQEPADLSIVLEWSVTRLRQDECHLGLGFDVVMPAVATHALSREELDSLVTRNDMTARSSKARSLLASAADPYFRLMHLAPASGESERMPAGYAVLVVLDGSATLVGDGETFDVRAGDAVAVPHDFGEWRASGNVSLLVGTPGTGWPSTLRPGAVHETTASSGR